MKEKDPFYELPLQTYLAHRTQPPSILLHRVDLDLATPKVLKKYVMHQSKIPKATVWLLVLF